MSKNGGVPIPMDIDEFVERYGASMADVGDAGAHKRGRRQTDKQWNRIVRRIDQSSADAVAKRADARRNYQSAVERGEIRPLTRREKLERVAAGHQDNESVRAARRILHSMDSMLAERAKDSP